MNRQHSRTRAQLALGVNIAVKFLGSERSITSAAQSRFAREVTDAARIDSAHTVAILDHGFTANGRGFIVLERLHGEDLGHHLARAYTMTPAELIPIIEQACQGLASAHALGIVHRNVEPENLFLSEGATSVIVKLLNVGISKHPDSTASAKDTIMDPIGINPLYMSPEQALGQKLDPRSDLYSLAVVAYRCLAGRPPFVYPAIGEQTLALGTRVPPSPSCFNPSIPPALDEWFAGMLRTEPDERLCQSATQLAESFTGACRGTTGNSPAGFGTIVPTGKGPWPVKGPSPSTPRNGRRHRVVLTILAGCLSAGIASAILWLEPRQREKRSEATPLGASLAIPSEAAALPSVNLHFAVQPREAALYLDGQRLSANPFSITRRGDRALHRLRAEAPGYETAERELTLERDIRLELVLPPLASSPPMAASPAPMASGNGVGAERRNRSRSSRAEAAASVTGPTPLTEVAGKPNAHPLPLVIDRSNPWQEP